MALLRRAASLLPILRPQTLRYGTSASSVWDHIVDLVVIDGQGRRHVLRGLVGQKLSEVLQAHVDTLGDDAVSASPEGRHTAEAHVKVPNELLDAIPAPTGDEERWLNEVAEPGTVDVHSRLASRIVLNSSMNGSLVALGQHAPWKTW